MSGEQRIRAFLFYLSVVIFFSGIPFILSSSLGYKFNPKKFKFTKTGLIDIKTQPADARIYFDGKLLKDKTPATIYDIVPGEYNLRIEMDNYYPWIDKVSVYPRQVSRVDKIVLFPIQPNKKQLNQERITSFWINEDRARIYYLSQKDKIIYESALDGDKFQEIASVPDGFSYPVKDLRLSPDKEKLLLFGEDQIVVVYLKPQEGLAYVQPPLLLDFAKGEIKEIFWYSDSYHLIVVNDKEVFALEAKLNSSPVSLVKLDRKDTKVFYDSKRDALYFMDTYKDLDNKFYDNVYKFDLSNRFSLVKEFITERKHD